jgi:Bacterial Ig domain
LAIDLGVSAAKRYCSGEPFAAGVDPQMARVFVDFSTDTVDWNGDGFVNPATAESAGYDGNLDKAIGTLSGYSDWDNVRLNQTGAVVTGVSAGSAEGVYFDNSGTANGVYFDQSGVFFDQSGVWFDQSGVYFDNAGGVFFDQSGVFFDQSGVYFDNSGVWFDNSGGVYFDNAGGVYFDNAGGVYFDNAGGVYFDNAGGVYFDNAGQEISYDDARSFGRGRPHRISTCVRDEDDDQPLDPDVDGRTCSTAEPNTAAYHRNEVQFEQLQVGGISDYEVQRRSLAALNPTAYVTAGTVAAHLVSFTDLAELADGIDYIYRVRGRSTDEFGNGGWSRLATETAVNNPPVAVNDGYSVAANTVLTVPAATGLLANDTQDVDSPASSRRLFSVISAPSHGTLTTLANGSFTYTPDLGYFGPDSFTYTADNGPWSGDPSVPLSPPSNLATVNITVTGTDSPSCTTTLAATVSVGSTTLFPHNCLASSGGGLTVTAVTPPTGGGTAAVTSPLSGSFRYTAPATATTADFTYTVTNNAGSAVGRARITVTATPPPPTTYGFVNVQNLPPSGNKSFKTASTVPLGWRWTSNGVAVDTAGQASVRAYVCAVANNVLPPGSSVGDFSPAAPGSGNSFAYDAASKTWTFNWKLQYTAADLPLGTYIVQVVNSLTGQTDPRAPQASTCAGKTGSLITVVKK